MTEPTTSGTFSDHILAINLLYLKEAKSNCNVQYCFQEANNDQEAIANNECPRLDLR